MRTESALHDSHSSLVVQEYVCASVDLLGQQSSLELWRDLDETNFEKSKKILINSLGNVYHVRESLVGFVTEFSKPQLDADRRSRLTPEQLAIFDKYATSRVYTQTFGDTVLMYAPINSDGVIQAKAVYGLILGLCYVFRLYMAAGIPIRGGIDIGLGCNIADNEIYGPVLASAHDLESRRAIFPRIAVGDGLVKFANHLISSTVDSVPLELYRALGHLIASTVTANIDAQQELNYTCQTVNDVILQVPIAAENISLRKMYRTAQSKLIEFGDEDKIRQKYEQVIRSLDRWGVRP